MRGKAASGSERSPRRGIEGRDATPTQSLLDPFGKGLQEICEEVPGGRLKLGSLVQTPEQVPQEGQEQADG